MAKKYTQEERQEVLRFAEEIEVVAAAKRLGINEDTLYGWCECAKQRRTITNEAGKTLTLSGSKGRKFPSSERALPVAAG